MPLVLPQLRVGDPLRYEGLGVFPLFAEPQDQVEYRVVEEALAGGSATVEEISETGSVPELLVDNRSDIRILLLEGEELRGAKQNRILNTSVLVAAHTKLRIPVSCVEQGRWRYSERDFRPSGHHVTAKLRRAVKTSVAESLKSESGHRSDQAMVWGEVTALHASLSLDSETAAMSDAFDKYQDQISEYRAQLKYQAGACGMALAIGGRVVSVDFFDKPATCARVWDRLLSGMVFDALEAAQNKQNPSIIDVERLLTTAGECRWNEVETVGEGTEFRAESPRGDHASALVLDSVVVHGSIMVTL